MSRERWFRSGDDAMEFDWRGPARELDVPLDIARALYLRATRLAPDVVERAEQLYLRWLREIASQASGAAAQSRSPGRETLLTREAKRPCHPVNTLISTNKLTGSGMQGELFEGWVIKHL